MSSTIGGPPRETPGSHRTRRSVFSCTGVAVVFLLTSHERSVRGPMPRRSSGLQPRWDPWSTACAIELAVRGGRRELTWLAP